MQYSEYITKRKQYQELGANLLLEKKHACLFFSPGKGKAIADYEYLHTPDGIRTVGDIREGDYLFDADGKPTKVLKVYPQGKKQIYRVKFTDGQTIDCCNEHLWELYYNDKYSKIYNTEDLAYRCCGNTKQLFFVKLSPIEYEYKSTNALGIDDVEYAYMIGLLLGDGCLSNPKDYALALSSATPELPKAIAKILGHCEPVNNKCNYTWYFNLLKPYYDVERHNRISRVQRGDILPIEMVFGVNSHTKFVPDIFKYNSIEIRKAVLQGILDSDGNVWSEGLRQRCSVATVSEQLGKDIAFLFRSLGYKCNITITKREQAYTISPQIPKNDIKQFFRLSTKVNRCRENLPETINYNRVRLESITILKDYADMTCFLVDNERHLFMIKDFIPTHNTYPTIDALKILDKQKNGNLNVLIISSADAIRKMWNVDIVPQNILPKNTYLVTDRTAIGDMSELLLAKQWDVIIVDECHIVKANSSQIHKLVYRLCKNVEYAWGLTGTPRGNTDIDIWCQLQALHVGGQGKMSYSAWTRIYCNFEVGYGAQGQFRVPVDIKEQYIGFWNQLLDDYCMFVDYDEDDDMPELKITVKEIPFVKTKEYDNALKGIIEVGEFSTTTQKMVAISKAHQVCNGYIYLPDKTIHRYANNTKLEYLKQFLNKEKVVIVYKHIADYEDLCRVYGSMATDDIEIFKSTPVKILMLQCGNCKSFNLQDCCNTIIFYTLDYSFIKYKQMIHRCWRLGQKRETEIVVLQHKDTVEKQIWNAVQNKQKMHDLYMNVRESL